MLKITGQQDDLYQLFSDNTGITRNVNEVSIRQALAEGNLIKGVCSNKKSEIIIRDCECDTKAAELFKIAIIDQYMLEKAFSYVSVGNSVGLYTHNSERPAMYFTLQTDGKWAAFKLYGDRYVRVNRKLASSNVRIKTSDCLELANNFITEHQFSYAHIAEP